MIDSWEQIAEITKIIAQSSKETFCKVSKPPSTCSERVNTSSAVVTPGPRNYTVFRGPQPVTKRQNNTASGRCSSRGPGVCTQLLLAAAHSHMHLGTPGNRWGVIQSNSSKLTFVKPVCEAGAHGSAGTQAWVLLFRSLLPNGGQH